MFWDSIVENDNVLFEMIFFYFLLEITLKHMLNDYYQNNLKYLFLVQNFFLYLLIKFYI